MIQDISPHVFYNAYEHLKPLPEDTALIYSGELALIAEGEDIRFPKVKDFPEATFYYLFSEDDTRFFLAVNAKEDPVPPAGFRFADVRTSFRRDAPREQAFAGVVGYHLYSWYKNNRFCGACGAPTVHSNKERALICPGCGLTVYPVIAPAVIVGVVHEGKLLMTKYAGRRYKNYALVAGYNEVGESVEETVHREVMEEVGLKVKNLRFYKSQPWPFTRSLLMGFFCELDGDDQEITLDRKELSEAGWFLPEEIPDDAEHAALTAEMMTVFKQGGVEGVTRPAITTRR